MNNLRRDRSDTSQEKIKSGWRELAYTRCVSQKLAYTANFFGTTFPTPIFGFSVNHIISASRFCFFSVKSKGGLLENKKYFSFYAIFEHQIDTSIALILSPNGYSLMHNILVPIAIRRRNI